MKQKIAGALCAIVMMPLTVFAQELTGQKTITLQEKNAKNAKNFRLDLSTPTSPGFSVIGASPKEISEPGNLQEFAINTASFIENGQFNPGLAINFQPFWMFSEELTMEEYTSFSSMRRIIARTQVSMASVQGATASASKGARYGLGFQTQLIDGRDPRDIETAKCRIAAWEEYGVQPLANLTDLIAAELEKQGDANVDAIVAQRVATYKAANYDKAESLCREDAIQRISRSNSWLLGAGIAGSSADASFDKFEISGTSVWTTFVRPFGENKSVTLFGKADIDHDIDIGGGLMSSANSYHAAISLAIEEPEQWKLEAIASYHIRDAATATFDDEYIQFSVGGTYKIRDGMWIEGSFGTRSGSKDQDETFSLIQLKLDLSQQLSSFVNSN